MMLRLLFFLCPAACLQLFVTHTCKTFTGPSAGFALLLDLQFFIVFLAYISLVKQDTNSHMCTVWNALDSLPLLQIWYMCWTCCTC